MMDLVEEQELEIGTRQDGDQSVVDRLVMDFWANKISPEMTWRAVPGPRLQWTKEQEKDLAAGIS